MQQSHQNPRRAVGLVCATSLGLALTLGALAPRASSAGQEPVDLATTRDTLDRWMQARGLISREKADWKLGRQVLEERIAVLERRIEEARATTAEAEGDIADAEAKRIELDDRKAILAEGSAVLAKRIAGFEARTLNLLDRCPQPIREKVKLFSQRIPNDPAQAKGSTSERYQFVIATLNEINRFQREITVTSEVRDLPEGGSAEVTAIYAGLGQAWYVGADGVTAGFGTGGPKGWTWRSAPDAARNIARAVAVLQNETVATFVQLPIDVEQGGAR
ncbi:MAG TPA: DUF3450 family protein [Planctomycetota bacterium]|nr:DUF3450 family protein [Planctomycetota bacterium]